MQESREEKTWVALTEHFSQTDLQEDFSLEPRVVETEILSEENDLVETHMHGDANTSSLVWSPSLDAPRLTKALRSEQLDYANTVMHDFRRRLNGWTEDDSLNEACTAQDLTDQLISQATDMRNLCRMYEGWMPWI